MFKVLTEGCEPTRGSKYSACVDLYASEDVVIGAGETKLVGLGVIIDLYSFFEKDFDLNKGTVDELYRLENTSTDKANFLAMHGENPSVLKREIEKFMNSHYLQLMLRSSLSKHLIIKNGVGVIDLDFPDEIMLRVYRPYDFKSISNIAIKWINKLGFQRFKYLQYEDIGLDKNGALVVKKANRDIKATKIAQITLLEHKGYLFGIESDVERCGGFGSTGK